MNPDTTYFESIYNEQVNFLEDHGRCFLQNNERVGRNKCLNRESDNSWTNKNFERRDLCIYWRDWDGVKERYILLYERPYPNDPRVCP